MNKETVLGVVRHVLTFGGGALGLEAYTSADELTAGISAVVTIIGLVWSVLAKKKDV